VVNHIKLLLSTFKGFLFFAAFIFIAIFTIENINGRFWLHDFKVYYSASSALLNGAKVYGVPFGLETGFFKYSPLVLFIFVPYTFFSFAVASVIHFLVISICTVCTIIVIQKIIENYFPNNTTHRKNTLLSISLICVAIHLVRELHLGNVNIILLLILTIGLLLLIKSRLLMAGIFIGFAMVVKPYFLLLLIPLLFHKKTKAFYGIAISWFISFLIPFLFLGFTKSVNLHKEWIEAMQQHSTYLTSNHTIQSLFQTYIYPYSINIAIVVGIVFIFYILTFILRHKNIIETELSKTKTLIIDYLVFIAIIPNLVITDTEHFLLSLPLIMLGLNFLFIKSSYIKLFIFIILIFFFGANSSDFLGNELSDRVEVLGLLGISNLGIIFYAIYIYIFEKKVFN
jgi:hypothetical protein